MFKVWLLIIPIIFSLNSVHLQYTSSASPIKVRGKRVLMQEEGILGNYLFSNKHDTTRNDEIKKELEQGKDSSDRYYEYSISIDEIKEFLYPDFYEKIKAD